MFLNLIIFYLSVQKLKVYGRIILFISHSVIFSHGYDGKNSSSYSFSQMKHYYHKITKKISFSNLYLNISLRFNSISTLNQLYTLLIYYFNSYYTSIIIIYIMYIKYTMYIIDTSILSKLTVILTCFYIAYKYIV